MNTRPSKLDVQAVLRHTDLFRELDEPELARVALSARQCQVDRGQVLFNAGDNPTGLYLVVRGQIKLVFTSPKGGEKIVELMGPGRTFGEALVFVPRPYPVRAQALVESLLLFVERDALFDELQRDKGFGARMIAGLSRRIHALMADLEAHSMHSGAQRFIGFLLRDYETAGTSGPVQIHLDVTKNVIASRLNLSQEHLSRILHELSEQQLIRVQGRDIIVPDVERLRQYGT